MSSHFLVAPSLLSADFSRLAEEIKAVEAAGADWLHVDVMDGHFVPNLTIGAPVVKSLRATTKKILDVHLMIENPEKLVPDFVDAGSDYITVHVEATKNPKEVLEYIRSKGKKAGITLKPATEVETIYPFLPLVDLVLIMTVNPGFGGQGFMTDQVTKITAVRRQIQKANHKCLIEVDGGINPETAKLCRDADVLVAGNYVFKNNYAEAIRQLRSAKS